ncbi:MAG: hypothetical protein GX608_08115 [Lentisphaerae bacterium]|nr:hypothetical protein [Lentisphaerota bacterium]
MSLKVLTRIPHGNAAAVEIADGGDMPEVRFAADPHCGAKCLWFLFRLAESDPDPGRQAKVRLVLKHFDNLFGASNTTDFIPVCQPSGQAWTRLKRGEEQRAPDGRIRVAWQIPHPSPWTDIAFCYPYGPADLDAMVGRSKEYWRKDEIGISRYGGSILRLSNTGGAVGSRQPGLFLIAQQNAGETPGSMVADGMLQYFSQVRKSGYTVWAVPIADIDGAMDGDFGRNRPGGALSEAWGEPPGYHEAQVIARDIARWKERCRPALALDFCAPGACDKDGVRCLLPDDAADAAMAADANKWANAFQNELKAEFAAADFKRAEPAQAAPGATSFAAFMRKAMGVCAFTIEVPYALAGETVLTKKHYREIGQRLAAAFCRRHSGG